MKTELSVLQTIANLHPAGGGPTRTVTHLTDALAAVPDVSVTLLCQSQTGAPVFAAANARVVRRVLTSDSALAFKTGIHLQRALATWEIGARPDVIHDNGLWLSINHWVACAARNWNTPLIIQPHGMLMPWALNHKAWKKRISMALYQRRNLATAKVLLATAQVEYENLRALGFRNPIAVIPNGVHFPATSKKISLSRLTNQPRRVLFLSRISPTKGLLNLINAWAQICSDGWRLQIAGPDEIGHLAEVLARAQQVGVADSIEYVGVVDGNAKSQLYHNADLFVLPTFTENFGVVVAEALAHGLPVITTRGAPWQDLATYKCGWWIDIGIAPLVAALREGMALSDAERQTIGANGMEYVSRYDWNGIAAQTLDVYRWVLGQGPKPDCVSMD